MSLSLRTDITGNAELRHARLRGLSQATHREQPALEAASLLKLPLFRGHLILMEEGVRNGKNHIAIPGCVQATHG